MIVLRNVISYILSLPFIELSSLFDEEVNRVHLVKWTGFIFTDSMFFWGKQIAGITALLYYIPCTLFSPFSDLIYGGIVDLTFRITTCRFLLAIVSRSWDLVVSTCHSCQGISCVRAWPRFAFVFVHRRGHHVFQRVELCIASARTTLAVSAVAPS